VEKKMDAEAKKQEGNRLWGQKKFAEALIKYNEALQLAPNDAKILCNKAACLLKLDKKDEALTEVNRAIQHSDVEYRQKTIQRKAEILRAYHRYWEVMSMFQQELKNEKDENKKKFYQDEIDKLKTFFTLEQTKKENAPFLQIKRIATMKPFYPVPGSADWKILIAHREWEKNLHLLRKLKDGYNPPPLPDIQEMSNIILNENRAYFFESQDDLDRLQKMIQSIQHSLDVVGLNIPASEIISTYESRLKDRGWKNVRPALSSTIRALIIIIAVNDLIGNFAESIKLWRQGIEILELADKKWPKDKFPDRGATISNTFIRKMKIRLIESISMLISKYGKNDKDLEEMKRLCNEVLQDCEAHPIDLLATGELDFYVTFQQYCIAEAHLGLAYYRKLKGCEREKDNKGYLIYNVKDMERAIMHYMYAIIWFPEDEQKRCLAHWSMLDCLIMKGGASLQQLLDYQQEALDQEGRCFPVWGLNTRISQFARSQIEILKERFDAENIPYDMIVPAMKEIETNNLDQAHQLVDVLKRLNLTNAEEPIKFINVLCKIKKDKTDIGTNID
jgi:tetratricopeptide (TPR) repeat protein